MSYRCAAYAILGCKSRLLSPSTLSTHSSGLRSTVCLVDLRLRDPIDAHFQQPNGSTPIPGITTINACLFASMRIVHPCSPHTQRCTDMHWPVMTNKSPSNEMRYDDFDLFKVVTAQTIFQGPYDRLFFTVNHEVIGPRLLQDDDNDEQSFIDIFRANLAPPVVHSVQNSNSFRNVNAFLAATKWGSENLDISHIQPRLLSKLLWYILIAARSDLFIFLPTS
ncbi:hypothetical protein BASA62_007402 [Batrachochytrium salamandrivorans]|nr:hypothetical protein BASA62_007402 [Batrachochytrium salamandrivorans]